MTDPRKLKIGLDASTLINHGQDIGAGRYILNLIRGLLSIDKRNEYLLFGIYSSSEYLDIAYDLKKEFADADISFKLIKAGSNVQKLYEHLRFPPIELFGFKADIFHCMDYLIPPTLNKNIVLTIHDLAFIRFPEFNFDWFIKKYKKLVRRNAIAAKKIIAVSDSTKNDIIKFYQIDHDKIKVVYEAPETIFKRIKSSHWDKEILAKYKIYRPYLLSVGTIEPRKNYITLIKVYNKIRKFAPDFKHKLVIAGRTGWKSEATYNEREISPYKEDIIFTGRISDAELVQIYNQASIFVFTSLFEGFGFPPLEAMSCGLPVICSNSSSIKEVAGNAGILLDPEDVSGFTTNILKLSGNGKLREKLSLNSLKQAGKFSWEKTARETLEVYKKVARY